MSTQSPSSSLLFTYTQPQQDFRLLELTPDLVELVSSRNAPILQLKSSSPSTATSSGSLSANSRTDATQYVHLCTPKQAYQIRQVSTSNSVYITHHEARASSAYNRDEGLPEERLSTTSTEAMTVVAQVTSVLELNPISYDVAAQLKKVIPVWNGRSDSLPTAKVSKEELYAEIPAPESQIESAWRRLFTFEVRGNTYRPSSMLLMDAWKKITETMALQRLSTDALLSVEGFLENNIEFDGDDEAEVVGSVIRAILHWLGLQPPTVGLAPPQTGDGHGSTDQAFRPLVTWVGELLLKVKTRNGQSASTSLSGFIEEWKDVVPEALREAASLELINREIISLDIEQNTIAWNVKNAGERSELPSAETDVLASKSKTVEKRKWHEKFKDSRNIKK